MPKRRVLTHERFKRAVPPDATQRELNAIREIAHALVRADRPEEVFQFALDRTSTLIGASFASVYLLEGVSELMRLVAASNWPEQHRPWLSEMRVRIGFGPSGEAAAERRAIEVPDVLADPGLEDWAEVARELGFRSLVALPLQNAGGAVGAVTFYFAEEGSPTAERRNLMRLVADQLAAAADKARMTLDLRRLGAALQDARDELDRAAAPQPRSEGTLDAVVARLAQSVATVLREAVDDLRRSDEAGTVRTTVTTLRTVDRALAVLEDVEECLAIRAGGLTIEPEPFSVHELVQESSRLADEWVGDGGVQVLVRNDGAIALETDRRKTVRILASLLVFADARAPGTTPTLRASTDGTLVRLSLQVAGPELSRGQVTGLFDLFAPPGIRTRPQASLALSRELAIAMGGSLVATMVPGQGLQLTCSLPVTARNS